MNTQAGLKAPNPFRGWAIELENLQDAIVVPAESRTFTQMAGVLRADGSYCSNGAVWRKDQEITSEPQPPKGPIQKLPGRWLWGGLLWRHFGHFTVESTGRLWGLEAGLENVQGVLFIPKSPKYGDELIGFQSDFMALAGASPKVLIAPTQVEELVVPGQGFGIGRIVLGTEACKTFFRDSFAPNIAPKGPEKLYISRSMIGPTKGALVCERLFEERLAEQGYTVFHPQKHDIATQIAHYRAARKVIASEGSAIHMFGLVAKPDQELAMVIRRKSKATKYIERHVRSFAGITPLMLNEVRRTWKPEGKTKQRFARGEPDYPAIQKQLIEHGFLDRAPAWLPLTEADVNADLNRLDRSGMVYRAVG